MLVWWESQGYPDDLQNAQWLRHLYTQIHRDPGPGANENVKYATPDVLRICPTTRPMGPQSSNCNYYFERM